MYLLTKTPFGRMCNAVRYNQQRAEFIDMMQKKIRWMAFSLSAMFAGAAEVCMQLITNILDLSQ